MLAKILYVVFNIFICCYVYFSLLQLFSPSSAFWHVHLWGPILCYGANIQLNHAKNVLKYEKLFQSKSIFVTKRTLLTYKVLNLHRSFAIRYLLTMTQLSVLRRHRNRKPGLKNGLEKWHTTSTKWVELPLVRHVQYSFFNYRSAKYIFRSNIVYQSLQTSTIYHVLTNCLPCWDFSGN